MDIMICTLQNLEKIPDTTLAINYCKVTQFRYSNGCYFTKTQGDMWEEHKSIEKLILHFQSVSRRYLKDTARQLLGIYGKSKDITVPWLLVLSKLKKKLGSDKFIDKCISRLQTLDYFCDSMNFWLQVNQPGVIGTLDLKLINSKCQIVHNWSSPVTKLSTICTEQSQVVPFDFPLNFHLCLAQGLFSYPKNERGERVILQLAGPERTSIIDWYISIVAGDYAKRVTSLSQITNSGCRIAFLELGDDQNASDILRDIRKMKCSCLIVLSTSDLTALNVDSFWIPNQLESRLATPVKQWISSGCHKYSIFECIQSEPVNQASELLEAFLMDQCIRPTPFTSKKKSSRMKLSELADVINNRARHQGLLSLKVNCSELKTQLKQRHYQFVRPQGTRYFTFKSTQ